MRGIRLLNIKYAVIQILLPLTVQQSSVEYFFDRFF